MMSAQIRKTVLRGTRKWQALELLDEQGGEMEYQDWVGQIALSRGYTSRFEAEVVEFLLRLNMIRVRDSRVMILDAGRWALGRAPAKTISNQSIAAPRTPAPVRPLAKSHMIRPTIARPGAFDYARIPSLMGNQRVPHHADVSAGADAE